VLAALVTVGGIVGVYLLLQWQHEQLVVEVTIEYPGATTEECYELAAMSICPGFRYGPVGTLVDAVDGKVTLYVTNAHVLDHDRFLADVKSKLPIPSTMPADAAIKSVRLLDNHSAMPEPADVRDKVLVIQIDRARVQDLGVPIATITQQINEIAPETTATEVRADQLRQAVININGRSVPLIELIRMEYVNRPVRLIKWH
jgi:hypothetical protein